MVYYITLIVNPYLIRLFFFFFFFTYLTKGHCFNPHRFSIIKILLCFFDTYVYVLVNSININQTKYHQFQCNYDVIYVKTVKTENKWQNLFLTIKILGTFDIYWVCGKSFLERIVKHNYSFKENFATDPVNKFGIKINNLYFLGIVCVALTSYPFLKTTLCSL